MSAIQIPEDGFHANPMSSGGAALYPANRFTAKAISDRVQFARYISAPMALRYGTSGPKPYSSSSLGSERILIHFQ
jgi:hypothetical protein